MTLNLGDRTVTRSVRVASSYCAANDPRAHFGLGLLEEVGEVRVTWQDGHRQLFGPFRAEQIVSLRRTAPDNDSCAFGGSLTSAQTPADFVRLPESRARVDSTISNW